MRGKYISSIAQTKRNLRVHVIPRSKIMPKICSKFFFIVFLVTRKKLIKFNIIIISYSNTLQWIFYSVINIYLVNSLIFFMKSQEYYQYIHVFWLGLQIEIIKRLFFLHIFICKILLQSKPVWFMLFIQFIILYYTVCKLHRATFEYCWIQCFTHLIRTRMDRKLV